MAIFLFSLLLLAVLLNIFTISSPWILLIIPLITLSGWFIGEVKAIREHNKILKLLFQTNKENNVSLMQQTFEAFKKEYESFKQNPPFEKQNETNEKLNNQPSLEESINQSIKGIE